MSTNPAPIPAENKQMAYFVAKAFGGVPRVNAYRHDHSEQTVDVLSAADQPEEGLSSYATLQLSDLPLLREGKEENERKEDLAVR